MKYFKCGNCKKTYKLDDAQVVSNLIVVNCTSCGAKNALRFGPILVAQTNETAKQIPIKSGENKIGRNKSLEVALNDDYVSRDHASVFMEEKEGKLFFFIKDNGSSNGTFNQSKMKLKPGLKYPFTSKDFYIVGLTKLSLKFN